jgi:hypothetical protein
LFVVKSLLLLGVKKRDEIQSLPLILVLQRNTTPRGSGHKADLGGRRGRNKKIELSNIKQIHH